MDNAVAVRADRRISGITSITMGPIREYCNRIGAKLIILKGKPLLLTADLQKHYRILQVKDILWQYERVLCLDADTLIMPDCPNLFDVVPEDKIGSIYEDKTNRGDKRRAMMEVVQKIWGDIGWTEGYTNAGVFVLSKQHANIFDPHKGEYWCQFGSTDVHMSYMIKKLGYEIHKLDYRYNHVYPFNEENPTLDRFKSFIIHYAGKGVFDPECSDKVEQIQADYEHIFR